ncbi:hypothetical protein [Aromatoleum petrolei]|uniref:Uncharacterized protein n=1 Tax=Aromatoleum petrolei TaxID=76116 RepID=A0ABX1MZF9_9RHOO|nr:hypothetical protein [Aromatoleum petrolei]NMF91439.1 hypothetical protein [Aromatoleum petrolei]QTQ36874.1 Uncharacterized protein ToN1_27380 [Aromatoleum petrolei]
MVKSIRTFVALVATPLVFAVGSAHAAYTGTCGAEFTTLEGAIAYAKTFKSEKDRTGMLSKVSGAVIKVDAGKVDDAVTLIIAVSDKADELSSAAKPKLGMGDATSIMNGAYATVLCLNPNYIP